MKKWIIIGTSVLGIFFLTAQKPTPRSHQTSIMTASDDITAVINKNSTEKDLEDLKVFFSENGIELLVTKIVFNKQNEITSLNLTLTKEGTKNQYSSSSNTPISEIRLGYKSGNLFITNSHKFDISSLKNLSNFNHPNIDIDSLMKKHSFSFNFDFDEENDSISFKSNFDIQKLKDQIMKSFNFSKDENGNLSFNNQQYSLQKYNFVDNPTIEKLIIIDGKESDFKTLNSLAKTDQLAEVDFLKSKTAISIYGDKAKDGAIIAITKK